MENIVKLLASIPVRFSSVMGCYCYVQSRPIFNNIAFELVTLETAAEFRASSLVVLC